MAIVLSDTGKVEMQQAQKTYFNSLEYRLFTNDFTPTRTNVAADFSGFPMGEGAGAAQTPVFADATLNGSNKAESVAPALTWLFDHGGGDFSVYGYWVKNPATGKVVWSQRWSDPFLVDAPSRTVSVTPKMTDDTA